MATQRQDRTFIGQYVEDIKLDLDVVKEMDLLAAAREAMRYRTNKDTLEYMVLEKNLADLLLVIKEDSFPKRHAKNLKLFNQVLWKHGVRQWMYNKSFIAHNDAVHKDLAKYFHIYVPAWAATDSLGLPAACGNTNQRQLRRHASDFFGTTHARRYLEISDPRGNFSSFPINSEEAPFEIGREMKTWLTR